MLTENGRKVGEVGMTAREDTIERIERVLNLTHKDSITVTIPRLTAERAVSLLKEQEPKPVGKEWNECPNCGKVLSSIEHIHFCGICGQAVKWE